MRRKQDSPRVYGFSESDDHPTHPEADYVVIFREVNTLTQAIKHETTVFVATMRKCGVQLPSPILVNFCCFPCFTIETVPFPFIPTSLFSFSL